MKTFGPFKLAARSAVLEFAESIVSTAAITVREELIGFWLDVSPDPPPEAAARLDALAGAHSREQRTATGAWPGASSHRMDRRGFYLDPGRAGISPRSGSRRDWDPRNY